MRSLGCSVKLSVFTSRQPPQSFEYRSNSDLIHSRAAPIPRLEGIAAGSCVEIVDLVPKLTNFSMLARIRWAEICFNLAAICGSAPVVTPCPCAPPCIEASANTATAALLQKIDFMVSEISFIFLQSSGVLHNRPYDQRRGCWGNRDKILESGLAPLTNRRRESKY